MIRVLHSLIDSVFPPRETEKSLRYSEKLPTRPAQYEGIQYLCDYQNQIVRAAIAENKFHSNKKATKLLSVPLSHWAESFGENTCFVPIPLSPERQQERGYNQVEMILKRARLSHESNMLSRIRNTQPQVGLPKQQRLTNVVRAFSVNPALVQPETTYVIVDDVVTTGATLGAARASLAPHLPSSSRIICLAIAH